VFTRRTIRPKRNIAGRARFNLFLIVGAVLGVKFGGMKKRKGLFGQAVTTVAALVAAAMGPSIPIAQTTAGNAQAQQIEQGQQKQQGANVGAVQTVHAVRRNSLGNAAISYRTPSSSRFVLTAKQRKKKSNRLHMSKATKRKHRRG
jgi:hypothetical protein